NLSQKEEKLQKELDDLKSQHYNEVVNLKRQHKEEVEKLEKQRLADIEELRTSNEKVSRLEGDAKVLTQERDDALSSLSLLQEEKQS
ncbi:hypothetical protein A2U01_0069028, partial [Trifolium medium]|nr:hypothetical protein [Trifolium medium]